ncbi:MAG: DUF924 domain-containing protein [Alphaproteobacteria bacterium]|nr:DUF924 domain-containing protein [Alphaproteobacteria bacterium]
MQRKIIDEMNDAAEQILTFWFGALDGPADVDRGKKDLWWAGGAEADAQIAAQFGALATRARAGELDQWAAEPRGCLALVVLLDQFGRSLGRGTAAAFAGDGAALEICRGAIVRGHDKHLRPIERTFLYMPLMHAEDRGAARQSVEIYQALSEEIKALGVDYPDSKSDAVEHATIVERFGRFPHRNAILGRESTPEEKAFLADGGPTFGQKAKA